MRPVSDNICGATVILSVSTWTDKRSQKPHTIAECIYSSIVTYHVQIASLSDNAALSGRAITTHVHLMNYTNTNQLIILFTSLSRLSSFMFYIIDMLSRWNNRAVIQPIGLTALDETMRRDAGASLDSPHNHKAQPLSVRQSNYLAPAPRSTQRTILP